MVKRSSIFLTFCLSLLCASREELGWDLSIQRIEPQDPGANTQYKIDVRTDGGAVRHFITTSIISATGAEGILGRGTRVWKALEQLEDGSISAEPVALKDYWIDDDRLREGEIYRLILEGLKGRNRCKGQRYLVKIECHGDVHHQKLGMGPRDGKTTVGTKMGRTSTRDVEKAIKEAPTQESRVATGVPTSVTPSAYYDAGAGTPLDLFSSVKTKNRIVMVPVGQSLHQQTSLRTIFKALLDVCNGESCCCSLSVGVVISVLIRVLMRR